MRLLLSLCFLLTLGLATAQFEQRYAAVPIAPDGLMPRYFLDKSNPVVKRQVSCAEDKHSCLDVGFGDQCCDDDTYCYINRSGDLKCCPFGSNCDNPCSSRSYLCTRTVTASGTPSAQVGCCGPSCPSENLYLCASSLGGNCCSFGAECRVAGCVATKTASNSASLTPIQEGCTTSQYKCADGSGCCDNTQICTEVSSTGYCTAGDPSATVSVITDPASKELSDGAKAGIGVGAVVGAALVIGGLTWLCISKRRQRQRTLSRHSGVEGSRTGGAQESATGGVDTMTEVSGTDHSRVRQGLTQDYFGPSAVAGPFTETSQPESGTSPGHSRAVPSRPDGPGDITAAVEIDSRAREPSSGYLSPLTNSSVEPTPMSENIDGRFELYGSDGREPLSIVPTPQESPCGKPARPTE